MRVMRVINRNELLLLNLKSEVQKKMCDFLFSFGELTFRKHSKCNVW